MLSGKGMALWNVFFLSLFTIDKNLIEIEKHIYQIFLEDSFGAQFDANLSLDLLNILKPIHARACTDFSRSKNSQLYYKKIKDQERYKYT